MKKRQTHTDTQKSLHLTLLSDGETVTQKLGMLVIYKPKMHMNVQNNLNSQRNSRDKTVLESSQYLIST